MSLENFKCDLTRSSIFVCGMYLYGASCVALFETALSSSLPTAIVDEKKPLVRFLNHPRVPKVVEGLGYVAATAVGGALMIFSGRF